MPRRRKKRSLNCSSCCPTPSSSSAQAAAGAGPRARLGVRTQDNDLGELAVLDFRSCVSTAPGRPNNLTDKNHFFHREVELKNPPNGAINPPDFFPQESLPPGRRGPAGSRGPKIRGWGQKEFAVVCVDHSRLIQDAMTVSARDGGAAIGPSGHSPNYSLGPYRPLD